MCLFFAVFPGKVQTPEECRRLLCAHQYSIPRSPAVSTASCEEERHGEASSSQTLVSERDETQLIFTVAQEMKKRPRGAPNVPWSSPLLEKSMTKKPIRLYSATPVHLEAAGTHNNRHVRSQNHPSYNSRGDSAPLGKDHVVVLNSCLLFSIGHFVFNFT